MKKTYRKPSTLLTYIGVHRMVCESIPGVTINPNRSVNATEVESRRGGSIWDDEEDDE